MDSGGCSAFILFTTPPMRVLGLPGLHLPMLKPTNPVLRWSQQSLTQIEMRVHRGILLYHNSRWQDFYLPDCGSFCHRTCMVTLIWTTSLFTILVRRLHHGPVYLLHLIDSNMSEDRYWCSLSLVCSQNLSLFYPTF